MWMRNVMAYRLAGDHALIAEKIAEALAAKAFVPAGKMDAAAFGWAAPAKHRPDEMAIALQDAVLISFQTETKILPPAVVNQEADARVAKIEAEETRRVGRRELRDIRERVTEEFLPRAFSKLSRQRALVDLKNNLVLVEASSSSKAEHLLSFLRVAVGELPTRLIDTVASPYVVLTSWLQSGSPEGFTLDDQVELESQDEGGANAKFKAANIGSDAIRAHLVEGMQVKRIAVSWADKISFVVTESLELKKLAMLDILGEKLEEGMQDCEDEAQAFDAQFALFIGSMREFLPAVFAAMGGEVPDLFDAATSEPEKAAAAESTLPRAGPADQDPMYEQAVKIVTEGKRASTSFVQRELLIGYNRAARLIEEMEENGIVSTMASNGSREVLAA